MQTMISLHYIICSVICFCCPASSLRCPLQIIGFSPETVAAFIAVVGILSILAQVCLVPGVFPSLSVC